MNVSSVLDGAADLIERDGWCREVFEDGPKHCLLGAVAVVAGRSYDGVVVSQEYMAIKDALGPGYPGCWNDAPGRTKEEVIAMLRAVAATERAREASPARVVAETQDALPESVS